MYTLTHCKHPPPQLTLSLSPMHAAARQQRLPWRGCQGSYYFHSFFRDTFFSESFFMTLATAISKSSCAAQTCSHLSTHLLFSLILCSAHTGLLARANAHMLHSAAHAPRRVTDVGESSQVDTPFCSH